MVTIYSVKNSNIGGDGKFLVEYRGLSTDDKPTTVNGGEIENGSVFLEIDTQDIYIYDKENSSWLNPSVDDQEDNQEDNQEGGE